MKNHQHRISKICGVGVLNSLLNLQFTNLCKSPVLEIAVLKIAVKTSIYKPMQIASV